MTNYLFALLALLLFSQCQSSAQVGSQQQKGPAFQEAFVLEKGAQVKVGGEGAKPIQLQLNSITDSRCPEDVDCMWQGNATVMLSASGESDEAAQLELCIGDCRPDLVRDKHTVLIKIGAQAYNITLLEVLPLPNSAENKTASKVKLLVEPVN